MNRRALLSLAAASLLTAGAGATHASKNELIVVKALLFTCPVCRETEAFDATIEREVRAVGGRFIPAPLPTGSAARERIYYAARDMAPQVEKALRVSLYKGTQDAGLPLADDVQVMVWLQTDLGSQLNVDWTKVIEKANEGEAHAAIGRAARLALSATVSDTPTYIFIKDGDIVETVDPPKAQGGTGALREMVLSRIRALSKPTKD